MCYLNWGNKILSEPTNNNIDFAYDQGYVFTRTAKNSMIQTRSVRVNLSKFNLSSENKRILRKTENITLKTAPLPHPDYNWKIHKLGKDFYQTKFGEKTFSANKIRELCQNNETSNFNLLFSFYNVVTAQTIGYCVCRQTDSILHYAYPFYDLTDTTPNLGIGMMTKTIDWAKKIGKKFVYLGSIQNVAGLYKCQFYGFEWWTKTTWSTDINKIKNIFRLS